MGNGISHPHGVLRRVEAVKGGGFQIELVAEHDHKGSQAGHARQLFAAGPAVVRARRQASEQNFTSSQVRTQRLRQVIGRPQATHCLLGSDCLLPLNDGDVACFIGGFSWLRRRLCAARKGGHVVHPGVPAP